MKYSIIVPIYNSEKTLSRCLDSILEQNYPDAELLLINDGSTDQSEEICRAYARKCPNILCKTTENHGVSAARNLGLDLARGTYILFVDSDDYVEPDYFRKLDCVLADEKPELVFLSYRLIGEQAHTILMPDRECVPTAEIAELVAAFLRKQQLNALWSKVFLRQVIEDHHLRFDEKLDIDEDVNFIFSYVLKVDSLRLSKEVLYNTTLENLDSLTRRKRDYLCAQLCKAGLNRKAILEASSLTSKSKRVVGNALDWLYYRGAYSSAAELIKYSYDAPERRRRIRQICCMFSEQALHPSCFLMPLLSIPVRLQMAGLIDFAARTAVRRRQM